MHAVRVGTSRCGAFFKLVTIQTRDTSIRMHARLDREGGLGVQSRKRRALRPPGHQVAIATGGRKRGVVRIFGARARVGFVLVAGVAFLRRALVRGRIARVAARTRRHADRMSPFERPRVMAERRRLEPRICMTGRARRRQCVPVLWIERRLVFLHVAAFARARRVASLKPFAVTSRATHADVLVLDGPPTMVGHARWRPCLRVVTVLACLRHAIDVHRIDGRVVGPRVARHTRLALDLLGRVKIIGRIVAREWGERCDATRERDPHQRLSGAELGASHRVSNVTECRNHVECV